MTLAQLHIIYIYQLGLVSCNSGELSYNYIGCTYQLVLISCNSSELSLLEDKAPVKLLLDVGDGLTRLTLPPPHQVDTRLELVHRVQDQLKAREP